MCSVSGIQKLQQKLKCPSNMVVVVAFSLLARIWEERLIIHSPSALFFFKWRLAHLFHSFMPGSVQSGSAS